MSFWESVRAVCGSVVILNLKYHNVKLFKKNSQVLQTDTDISFNEHCYTGGTSSVEGKNSFRLSYTGYTPRFPTADVGVVVSYEQVATLNKSHQNCFRVCCCHFPSKFSFGRVFIYDTRLTTPTNYVLLAVVGWQRAGNTLFASWSSINLILSSKRFKKW